MSICEGLMEVMVAADNMVDIHQKTQPSSSFLFKIKRY